MSTVSEKLWGGRFSKATHALVDQFNASINVDKRLAQVDIIGSLAHVTMLAHCNIISDAEASAIKAGLKNIQTKLEQNQIEFRISDEDIHMNIERLLFAEIGDVAGKLHTGRSRNDQVALDMHLYLREQVLTLIELIIQLQQALLQQAELHIDTIMPGYTHLQRAQPVRLAHHLLAYVNMLQRDSNRLIDSWPRINTLPLGAGALAGAGFGIDRDYVAKLLNFDQLYLNSMDAVSDRDYIVEFLADAALIIMHLSRLSEEFILWCSQEFNFIELDDAFCTGSSMMPQKKNPDVAELTRGKTGRVYGALHGLLTTLKGLPLAYNKDMQEDKEGLFDVIDTLTIVLQLYTPMISTMQVKKDNMHKAATQSFANATQLADYLVAKGLTFRESHTIVGQLVLHCIQDNTDIESLSLPQLQQFCPQIENDIFHELAIEQVVNARDSIGGTAKAAVTQQLTTLKQQIEETKQWLTSKQQMKLEL